MPGPNQGTLINDSKALIEVVQVELIKRIKVSMGDKSEFTVDDIQEQDF